MAIMTRQRNKGRRLRLPLISTVVACFIYAYLILPSLTVIPISFSENFSLDPAQFSLALYRKFFASHEWLSSMGNSAVIATCTSLIAVMAGIPAAYAFSRGRFRGKNLGQLLVMCPMFVPVIVVALGLYFLGTWLGTVGTRWMLILAHTMYAMPFVVIMILSGLRQVDPGLERVAMMMGASPVRIFVQIVLPQLKIPIFASLLFAFLVSFDEVMIAWFLSGPQTITLPVKMYSSIMWNNSPEIAVVSTLLTVFSFAICIALIALGGGPVQLPGKKR